MKINNNLSALFVARQMNQVSGKLASSIEKLSTGLRINRAGDDASNLAVSEKMRTQIRGLHQAEENAMMGLSFIQVAEGNMEQVNNVLQRVRELSVQAANGIYSPSDRMQIQVEVSQLINEVDRISTQAEFNRRKLLNGDLAKDSQNPTRASVFFHVGANQDQRLRAFISTMNSKAFGFGQDTRSISSVAGANRMIGTTDAALDKLNKQRADLGAYYNRISITVDSLRTGYMNMVAAESQIRDTDIATELVEFTKNQILMQSSTAMMVQANLTNSGVLKLLDRF
jgi:flagellin